jgi:hypothetical protein
MASPLLTIELSLFLSFMQVINVLSHLETYPDLGGDCGFGAVICRALRPSRRNAAPGSQTLYGQNQHDLQGL